MKAIRYFSCIFFLVLCAPYKASPQCFCDDFSYNNDVYVIDCFDQTFMENEIIDVRQFLIINQLSSISKFAIEKGDTVFREYIYYNSIENVLMYSSVSTLLKLTKNKKYYFRNQDLDSINYSVHDGLICDSGIIRYSYEGGNIKQKLEFNFTTSDTSLMIRYYYDKKKRLVRCMEAQFNNKQSSNEVRFSNRELRYTRQEVTLIIDGFVRAIYELDKKGQINAVKVLDDLGKTTEETFVYNVKNVGKIYMTFVGNQLQSTQIKYVPYENISLTSTVFSNGNKSNSFQSSASSVMYNNSQFIIKEIVEYTNPLNADVNSGHHRYIVYYIYK